MHTTSVLLVALILSIVFGLILLIRIGRHIENLSDETTNNKTASPENFEKTTVSAETQNVETPSPALFAKKKTFADAIRQLFLGAKNLADILPELEEILLTADVGIDATETLITKLQQQKNVNSLDDAFNYLKKEISVLLTPKNDFTITKSDMPFVIYIVGVNGVGKTTTIGKLASQFKALGHSVLLVAADTFRAAAVDQLKVWAERNAVDCIAGNSNADPASVIVDGLRSAKAKGCDVVLIDTAGRLHTKTNLMQELQKMARMCDKELNKPADEIFLVLDAITGQNGLAQAQIFFEAIPLSGIILTKYDSTSKGGVILSVAQKTQLPVRYIGLGEKIEDLKKFDAADFVERIFA